MAKCLLAQAKENEPSVTADLQTIASEVSAEMIGLENRFKPEMSLVRKLSDTIIPDLQTIQEAAEVINDVLRYTFVLPFETYSQEFRRAVEKLQKSDYRIPEKRIWNAWQTAGRRFDKGYRGINMTIISSQSQKFELQFHTAESYRLKTETHFLYKELRDGKISKERQSEIIEILKKTAKNIKSPQGV